MTTADHVRMTTAGQIVTRAIDAAGQGGGRKEVEAIAARGPGHMEFSAEEMAVLVEAYGSPDEALYTIQLEARRRVAGVRMPFYETVYEATDDGEEISRVVPCYVPGVGESVNDVAAKLGLRPLGRREPSPSPGSVVALVLSGGLCTRLVQS